MLNYQRVTIYNQPCANFLTSSDHRAMAGVVNGSSRGLPRAPELQKYGLVFNILQDGSIID